MKLRNNTKKKYMVIVRKQSKQNPEETQVMPFSEIQIKTHGMGFDDVIEIKEIK